MGCSGSKPAPAAPAPRRVEPANPEVAPRVKLVLLGDSGVGKSCIMQRYVRGAFDPSSKVTVGAAFMSHSLNLPNGKTVKFEIWDTAGQERYASLAPLYYRGASAAIIVYDVTSKDSFLKAKHWVSELHKNVTNSIVIILVGNKTDLADQRVISEEEGRDLADRSSMLFVETSAKTAANCSLVFETVAKKVSGYEESDAPAPVQQQTAEPASDSAPPLSTNPKSTQ